MSSFMVSNESLRKIATVLRDCLTDNYKVPDEINTYHLKKSLEKWLDTDNVYEAIYSSLYGMNVDALNARYDDPSDMYDLLGQIPKPIEGECGGVIWTEDYPLDKPEAFYKTIQCYLYQCSESEKIENSTLFKAVEWLEDQVARYVVERSAAYRNADWA